MSKISGVLFMRSRRVSPVLAVAALALAVAACGNSTSSAGGDSGGGSAGPGTTVSSADLQKRVTVNQPGVTDSEIRVGGVVSKTNPIGGQYADAAKGVQAYFDMINAKGGIYGRKLVLSKVRDDNTVKNQEEVQALISEDNVFAALPIATLLFGGAEKLAKEKIPTFGWNINEEWTGPNNLFGEKGSYLCIDCAHPTLPYLAKQVGAKKIGLLAYTAPQSKACLDGDKKAFSTWPTAPIAFEDSSIPFGGDLAVQVNKMKEAGVDLVLTCMDTNGAINLAKEMKKQDLKATQFLPNGYDANLVGQYPTELEGAYVGIGTVPFEAQQKPQALRDFETGVVAAGGQPNEVALAGWLNADLLYQGLVRAGPDFTRQKVIDGINTMTDWTAGGVKLGTDWTIEHEKSKGDSCTAFVKIENGRFVPVFGQPGKPFICMKDDDTQAPSNAQAEG